ncbi:MAG: PAS domain-containing protein [Limnospira sp.]
MLIFFKFAIKSLSILESQIPLCENDVGADVAGRWLHLGSSATVALLCYVVAIASLYWLADQSDGDRRQISIPPLPRQFSFLKKLTANQELGGTTIGPPLLLSFGLLTGGTLHLVHLGFSWPSLPAGLTVAGSLLTLWLVGIYLLWLWRGYFETSQTAPSSTESAPQPAPPPTASARDNRLSTIGNRHFNSPEQGRSLTQFSIDKAADAIFWIGDRGQILYVNDAACRMLGYAPAELLTLTIHDINPDFPESSWDLHWKILRRCGSLKIEARHQTKHRRLIPVEMTVNHLNFQGQEYQCVFVRDISDRKQVERTLRERQGEFRTLVSSIPGAVYRCNADGDRTMTFLSPGVESITGYGPHELIQNRARTFASLIHPDDRLAVSQVIEKAIRTREPYILEYRLLRADGTLRWVYEKGQGIFDDNGQVLWLAGAIFDITNRKEASEALRLSEERLQLALSGTDQGLWDWNLNTDEVYFSPQWGQMLGYEADEIEPHARSWFKLVHPDDRPQVMGVLKQHLATRLPFCEVEHRMLAKNGSWKWILNHGRVVSRDSDGKPTRMTGTVKDVSDRKRAEEALRVSEARERARARQLEQTLKQLRQAQAQLIQTEKLSSLGQMVAGIAHEINNPVTFIYGNISYAGQYIRDLLKLVELYQKHYPDPVAPIGSHIEEIELGFIVDDLPKILSSMEVGANRIRQIVVSLRNFARLDEAEMKPVDIHEGIESALLILQHRLKGRVASTELPEFPEIQVIREYGNLPQIECYAGQLNQVFMSILNNAIDAILEIENVRGLEGLKPAIRIGTELLNSDWVSIRISDNGLGMSEEVRRRLFEPFFTTKPVGRGTGLGLAISYQIVAKHGGRLTCHSTPEIGSEFAIEIPRKTTRLEVVSQSPSLPRGEVS